MTYLIGKLEKGNRFRFSILVSPFPVFHWIVGTYVFVFLKSSILFTSGSCLHHKTHVYFTDSLNMSIFTYFFTREYLYSFLFISTSSVMVIYSRIFISSLLKLYILFFVVRKNCLHSNMSYQEICYPLLPIFLYFECISKVHILILCVCACALEACVPKDI